MWAKERFLAVPCFAVHPTHGNTGSVTGLAIGNDHLVLGAAKVPVQDRGAG